MTVRVRFAPSPTGALTVGGLRSSLFNYLFARHHGGSFILRIEDTDRTRLTPGALEALLESHRWLGLDWDEGPDAGGARGPYFQSERLPVYHAAAERLLANGSAYPCICTEERLNELRAEQRRQSKPTGYDRRCRALSPAERQRRVAAGEPYVVRFAMPLDGETTLEDPIRGTITWKNANYDDHVLVKSDGFPTYGLAAIVDDHEMGITHAFRAEEWLPSTPRHLQTFYALGVQPPQYCHLPVILGKDRKKLSKRHGDTSVMAFRDQGYLPEAMFNFLGLVGWSLDDHSTIIGRQTFIDNFTLDRVVRAPALFDLDKLLFINSEYIKAMSDEAFADFGLPFLERDLPAEVTRPVDRATVATIASAARERIKKFDELAAYCAYLFVTGPLDYDAALLLRRGKKDVEPDAVRQVLKAVRDALASAGAWDGDALVTRMQELEGVLGLKFREFAGHIRVTLSGQTVTLPLHTMLNVLGREESLARFDQALEKLAALEPARV